MYVRVAVQGSGKGAYFARRDEITQHKHHLSFRLTFAVFSQYAKLCDCKVAIVFKLLHNLSIGLKEKNFATISH